MPCEAKQCAGLSLIWAPPPVRWATYGGNSYWPAQGTRKLKCVQSRNNPHPHVCGSTGNTGGAGKYIFHNVGATQTKQTVGRQAGSCSYAHIRPSCTGKSSAGRPEKYSFGDPRGASSKNMSGRQAGSCSYAHIRPSCTGKLSAGRPGKYSVNDFRGTSSKNMPGRAVATCGPMPIDAQLHKAYCCGD